MATRFGFGKGEDAFLGDGEGIFLTLGEGEGIFLTLGDGEGIFVFGNGRGGTFLGVFLGAACTRLNPRSCKRLCPLSNLVPSADPWQVALCILHVSLSTFQHAHVGVLTQSASQAAV